MSSESNSGSEGSMLDEDVDWDKLYAPGDIKVGSADRRRLLEDLGAADNPRVRFFDDAAKMDIDSTDNGGER